jgi:hypothetical protein
LKFVVVDEIAIMLSAALPVFVSVTVCAALLVPAICAENARVAGESATTGEFGSTPMPVKLTACKLVTELSKKVSVEVSVAATGGVNATLTVHFAFGATVVPLHKSALIAKSIACPPESVTALGPKIKLAIPLFVTVMDCAGLGVFIC